MLLTIACSLVIGVFTLRFYLRSTWKRFEEEVGDLTGKVVVVTGANSGIGYAAAEEFARRKARVILACRSRERGEAARRAIASKCGGDVIMMTLDTSDFASVREFCRRFVEKETRLDILVNNAGISRAPVRATAEGSNMDVCMATNYFGHFLLTNLLMDVLKTSRARVVNVTSFYHPRSPFDSAVLTLDELQSYKRERSLSDNRLEGYVYAHSKLLMMMFTAELARRTSDAGIVTSCLCPGVVRTNIMRDPGLAIRVIVTVLYFFGKSPAQGAENIVHCALSRQLTTEEGRNGRYVRNCADAELHAAARDPDECASLWRRSRLLVGLSE